MSTGLACVVSDISSNESLLKGSGIVISGSAIEERLPGALQQLLDKPEYTKELGKKARKKVLQYHQQDKIFGELEKALTNVVKKFGKHTSNKNIRVLPLEDYE
jgi:glycosyltransferase involved in cell wall biosynthesis